MREISHLAAAGGNRSIMIERSSHIFLFTELAAAGSIKHIFGCGASIKFISSYKCVIGLPKVLQKKGVLDFLFGRRIKRSHTTYSRCLTALKSFK